MEAQTDGVVTASYVYDDNGNRISVTRPSGTESGTYDAQDRLLYYGTATYGYTKAGELRFRAEVGDTTFYRYDVLGNLLEVNLPDGMDIEYVVDGLNRRVGEKVNGQLAKGWLYQGPLKLVAELDTAGGVVSGFVYGSRSNVPDFVVKSRVPYRIIADNVGSVRLVVNTVDGSIAQRLDYDEAGRITLNSNPGFQPFAYAGGIADRHTRFVRFGARDYDPETGRWTTKDPILFFGGSSNLYAYTLEDPVNEVDPDGLQPVNLGGGWTGRIDRFNFGGRASHEVHVFDPTGREVGIFGREGWIGKHGFAEAPSIPRDVLNRLNGANVTELRAQGLLGRKGTQNIRGFRYLRGRVLGLVGFLGVWLDARDAVRCAELYGGSPFYWLLVFYGAAEPPQIL